MLHGGTIWEGSFRVQFLFGFMGFGFGVWGLRV